MNLEKPIVTSRISTRIFILFGSVHNKRVLIRLFRNAIYVSAGSKSTKLNSNAQPSSFSTNLIYNHILQ